DNSTIVALVRANAPRSYGCTTSWKEECVEFVFRNYDHCEPICGDAICAEKSGETCEMCPEDCGTCNPSNSCSYIDEQQFKSWRSLNDTYSIFQDPKLTNQWFMYNRGQKQYGFQGTPGVDVNIMPVYQEYQLFGEGITVGVVDDGLYWRHPDLQCGYKPELSYDIDQDVFKQEPNIGDDHGTCCAGLCCGGGNNTACGVGVAFKSNFAGLRLLGDNFSDTTCATALVHMLPHFDIYSNSWGPTDDGVTIERFPLTLAAIEMGIRNGRQGKGIIYMWAAGNGYTSGDGSNYDELSNSPYTISIAASDWNGKYSTYSEPGTNVIANTASSSSGTDPDSGNFRWYGTMVTTDRTGFMGYNTEKGPGGNCAVDFGGTSASCPLAAGIMAVVLQANPNLTWRDMQWLIVLTSIKTDLEHSSWTTNAAGYTFSKHYGFGMLSSHHLVQRALNWTNVCDQHVQATKTFILPSDGQQISKDRLDPVVLNLTVSDDIVIEHVVVTITAETLSRGALVFGVRSPEGTMSILSEGRRRDSGANYDEQRFSSMQMWGERSRGVWYFSIYDNNVPASSSSSILTSLNITILGGNGICKEPTPSTTVPPVASTTPNPTIPTNPGLIGSDGPISVEPIQSTPKPTNGTTNDVNWSMEKIRNLIVVVLIGSTSVIVATVIIIWVLKMQKGADKELNNEIWNEMID
ncbi:hypothetical protein AKO1_011631, partial [Acrasis kona]